MKSIVQLHKLFILVIFSLLMTACNLHPPLTDETKTAQQWENRQVSLKEITAYQVSGSLAYFSDKTRHFGRFFIIQQAPNEYQLKLNTPVGSPVFSLIVTPYMAQLTDNNGAKYTDENVERLMAGLTGLTMPFNTLHSWIIGLSNTPSTDKLDDNGRLVSSNIKQKKQTWQLAISKYHSVSYQNKNIDLPAQIVLTNKDHKVRLTLENWKIN